MESLQGLWAFMSSDTFNIKYTNLYTYKSKNVTSTILQVKRSHNEVDVELLTTDRGVNLSLSEAREMVKCFPGWFVDNQQDDIHIFYYDNLKVRIND